MAAMNSSMENAVPLQTAAHTTTASDRFAFDCHRIACPPSFSMMKLIRPKFSPKSHRQITPTTMGEISHGTKKMMRAASLPFACRLTSKLAVSSENTKVSGTTSTAYSSVRCAAA